MKVEITGAIEKKVIQKFSKFIMEFKDTYEFIDYIKQNKFKIVPNANADLNVPDEDKKILKNYEIPWEHYKTKKIKHRIYTNRDKIEYNIQEKWLLPARAKNYTARIGIYSKYHTITVLPYFYYISFYLTDEDKTIGFLPLNSLIRRINIHKFDIDALYNDMEKDGRFFVYWSKKYMLYDTVNEDIEVITIFRKYIGIKKHELLEETRIIVEGSDGKNRAINEEAIFYFKQEGLNVVKTMTFSKVNKCDYAGHNFLEDVNVRKIMSDDDFKKIKSTEDPYAQNYQLNLTGFPDLFVWDKEGNYFFVEVKSEKDKLHLNQREWIKWNQRIGKFRFKILQIKNC